jgi:hypothetical protein
MFMDIPWGTTLAEVRRTHVLELTSVRGNEEQYSTGISEWEASGWGCVTWNSPGRDSRAWS